MSDKHDVFDAMLKALFRSKKEHREGLRWEMNHACKMRLLSDESIYRQYLKGQLEDRPFLGLPIVIFKDQSDDPKFNLIVKEKPQSPKNRSSVTSG